MLTFLKTRVDLLERRIEFFSRDDRLRPDVLQIAKDPIGRENLYTRARAPVIEGDELDLLCKAVELAERLLDGKVKHAIRRNLVAARDGLVDPASEEIRFQVTHWINLCEREGINPFAVVSPDLRMRAVSLWRPEAIRELLALWFKGASRTATRPFPGGYPPLSLRPTQPVDRSPGSGDEAPPVMPEPSTPSSGPPAAPVVAPSPDQTETREGRPIAPNRGAGGVGLFLGAAVILAGAAVAVARRRSPARGAPLPRVVTVDRPEEGQLVLGLRSLRKGEYERALSRFQALLTGDDPSRETARGWVAVTLLKMGHTQVCEEELARLDCDRVETELLYELALACEEAGLPAHAQKFFQRVYVRDVMFRDVAQRVKKPSRGDARQTLPSLDPSLEAEKIPRRYGNLALVSRGGMGAVLSALDRELGRRVAIKLLLPEFRRDERFVERFHREARAIAAISHPNIVQIFDVQSEPVPFFTMEYLDGVSLESRLRSRTRVDVPWALAIGRQIALGLAHLHSKGIVHRDVKPGNVMLLGGSAKLVDFGLAVGEEWTRLTEPRSRMGTPPYMAPEVVTGNAPDTCADVFALGIVIRELLTGQYPFHGKGTFPQLNAEAAPLKEETRAISTALADVLDGCLVKDPTYRVVSASLVADAIADELTRPRRDSAT